MDTTNEGFSPVNPENVASTCKMIVTSPATKIVPSSPGLDIMLPYYTPPKVISTAAKGTQIRSIGTRFKSVGVNTDQVFIVDDVVVL